MRSNWGKVLFVLATIPMAVAKNAVRIFTLSMLGMHVNPGFLDGRLHRNGGVAFFVVALAGMVALLRGLQKAEAWTGGASVVQLCAQHLSSLKSWAI